MPARHSTLHTQANKDVIGVPVAVRRLRRDAEANRQHILEAAGTLMAERGLATPLEDIAAAAGVGVATLYRRFPTRTTLIEALFQDRFAAYLADLETAVGMPDGWEALLWFLRKASGRQIADRALNELLDHDPGADTIRHLIEQVKPLAMRLVERAQATGRLRPDFTVTDLGFLQKMLVAVGAAMLPVSDTAWERYLTFLADGLIAARGEPSPAAAALTVDQVQRLHTAAGAPERTRR